MFNKLRFLVFGSSVRTSDYMTHPKSYIVFKPYLRTLRNHYNVCIFHSKFPSEKHSWVRASLLPKEAFLRYSRQLLLIPSSDFSS